MKTDHDPWRDLVGAISAFVSKRVPDSDVDDVVQDILIRAYRGAASLRDQPRAEAWLFAIARRAIADFYRKRQRQTHVAAVAKLPAAADERAVPLENLSRYTGDHDVHEEVLSWLRPMADELDEPYCTAIIRADFESIPQRELAKKLRVSEAALKSRVQRGRKMLADALKRCCQIEFGPKGRAVAFVRLRGCACEK